MTFMMTAFSGTSNERNTIISSTNDSSSTTPMKIGRRSDSYEVKSLLDAVERRTREDQLGPDQRTALRSAGCLQLRQSLGTRTPTSV
jgi:hypothetical protein